MAPVRSRRENRALSSIIHENSVRRRAVSGRHGVIELLLRMLYGNRTLVFVRVARKPARSQGLPLAALISQELSSAESCPGNMSRERPPQAKAKSLSRILINAR